MSNKYGLYQYFFDKKDNLQFKYIEKNNKNIFIYNFFIKNSYFYYLIY